MAVPGAIARSTACALASHSERGDGNPIQNSDPDAMPGGRAARWFAMASRHCDGWTRPHYAALRNGHWREFR